MSSITNIITTVYRAQGGQAISQHNLIAKSIQNIGNQSMAAGRNGGVLNSQLRAIGTTIRYAFAGSLVFGVRNMLQNLTETQRTLALIGAAGEFERFDNLATSVNEADQALASLYDNAQRGAVSALTPVLEFNQGLLNMFSTVQNLDPKMAVEGVTEIAKTAQMAQVSTEDLTRSVTGMAQAFGMAQTPETWNKFLRGFAEVIFQAPGGAVFGPQIIQQLPNLAAVARFASVKPEEMMGLTLTALRTGASPSTGLRGLQYLLQSIGVPQSQEARKALAQAGITPTTVQQRGGMWALQQLLGHARSLGLSTAGAKKLGSLSEEQADMLDALPPGQAAGTLGVSGPALDFLSQAIGRIHGIRTLVTIMAQQQSKGQMTMDLEAVQNAMSDTAEAQAKFRKKWEDFARRQPLKAAAIGVDALRSEINEAVQPILAWPARQIGNIGMAAVQHERATHIGAYAVGGTAAALGIARLISGPGLAGRILGRGAQGVLMAKAASDLNATGLGASPQTPLYVIVVGQLFGGRGGGGPLSPTGNPGSKIPPAVPWWQKVPGLGAMGLSKLGVAASVLGPIAPAFPDAIANAIHPRRYWGDVWNKLKSPGFFESVDEKRNRALTGLTHGLSPAFVQHARFERANKILDRDISRIFKTSFVNMQGKAMVELDVLSKDASGRQQRKKMHVPMDLWTEGAVPSSRGNKRTMRNGR